jgi:transposase-like protein
VGDIGIVAACALSRDLAKGFLHVDGVPIGDGVQGEAEGSELLFLPLAKRTSDFRPPQPHRPNSQASDRDVRKFRLVIAFAARSNHAMIPEAKRAQIIEALQSNPNLAAVARQVGGVSRGTVSSMARKLGLSPSGRSWTKFPPAAHAKIVAALRNNPNAAAVAREIGGISSGTVSVIAKKANIPLAAENMEKAKRLSPEKRAQIVEALAADPNASRVARHVGGISPRTVQKIAEKTKTKLTAVSGHGTPTLAQAEAR